MAATVLTPSLTLHLATLFQSQPATTKTISNDMTSATSTDDGGSPGGVLNPNSSLPFSFLVTFIAVFLFFLGCGLGSRRVTRTLRRNFGLQITGLDTGRAPTTLRQRPILWDVFPNELPAKPGPSGIAHTWRNLTPICATYVRTTPPQPDPAAAPAAPTHTHPEPDPPPSFIRWAAGGMGAMGYALSRAGMRTLHVPIPATHLRDPAQAPHPGTTRGRPLPQPEMRWRGHRIPDFIARPLMPEEALRRAQARAAEAQQQHAGVAGAGGEEEAPVRGLQVLVLVSMPSPERTRAWKAKGADVDVEEEGREGELGEYTLGVACVPWSEEAQGGQAEKGRME